MCSVRSIKWVALLLFFIPAPALRAQDVLPKGSPEQDKVKNMVHFLEYMLNTLGSEKTSARDKEVLVTESYKKIFRDDHVQVEDDLDAKREVITNKDVPAYLKDVDFFFKDVRFEFTIEGIEVGERSNANTFYKVSLLRNLQGTTVGGETINNTMKRFMEINYDPEAQDLKIVSIYTHEFDERAALTYWWGQLSYEWQSIFKTTLNLTDSVSLEGLKRITGIVALDLSGNTFIQDIAPLSQLHGLQSLNLARTRVADLGPIRNLTGLTELDISHTMTMDLSPLRYARALSSLSLAYTPVKDLTVVENMPALKALDLRGTQLSSYQPLGKCMALQRLDLGASGIPTLQPLNSLTALERLDISHTAVVNVGPLAGLANISVLVLDSNRVADLHPLKGLQNLEELYLNHTLVSDLSPLGDLQKLKRIYCDHTAIDRAAAEAFMTASPEVLVIYDSEDMRTWWEALPATWKKVFQKALGMDGNSTKEGLAKIAKLDSVNLAGTGVATLGPLQRLYRLRSVVASHTAISDLQPLQKLADIAYLDISHTAVKDLTAIVGLGQLKGLRASHTLVAALPSEWHVPSLKYAYLDGTGVDDSMVRDFLGRNPYCLVVYKTDKLNRWWEQLPRDWNEIFRVYIGNEKEVSTEALHQLVEGERLYFQGKPVASLEVLGEFIRLEEVRFSGTGITDLTPLAAHATLRLVQASKSPLVNIGALSQLPRLEDLDLSGTPVESLGPLAGMLQLKRLDCSGTRVRRLNGLETLLHLQYLDCSSTAVRNLAPLANISLKKLVCYNTRVSARKLEAFREGHPECEVVFY